jgi:hypothetical protein
MTGLRHHGDKNVEGARPARGPARRAIAWLLCGAAVLAVTIGVYRIGGAAAQLEAVLRGAAAVKRSDDVAPARARVASTPAQSRAAPRPQPRTAAPVEPARVSEPDAELDSSLDSSLDPAPPARGGPPSAEEFARLLESGALPVDDPDATAELERALAGAQAEP